MWTQWRQDTSMGEDLELDYPGPCPWLSVAPAVEQEAERRPSHPNGRWEICPQSGGDERASKCLTRQSLHNKEETLWQTISSRHSNSPILMTAACKRVSCSISQQLTRLLSWQQLNFLSSTRTRQWSRSSKEHTWLSPCKAPLSLLSK